ncbi:hypothetical protein [Catenulispora subtropica]|uniref:Uncharacterized protein n=1 Tax=Catenulispora subtropica TaxID=450798 RepID=A0ABN2TAH0_9ACTN
MTPFPEHAPTPVRRVHESRPRIRLHRRLKPTDPRSWNLMLASAGTRVPVRMVLDRPELLKAAVEDLEWRLALEELRARRPHRWQKSETAAWTAERDRLEEERRRIAEIAAEAVSTL